MTDRYESLRKSIANQIDDTDKLAMMNYDLDM